MLDLLGTRRLVVRTAARTVVEAVVRIEDLESEERKNLREKTK
jgi:hypothetical protein